MRVGVIGSRDYPELGDVVNAISALEPGTVIVSGGARGVDRTAEVAAQERGLHVVSFRPHEDSKRGLFFIVEYHDGVEDHMHSRIYSKFATAAFARNALIVNSVDHLIAFQYNGSRGTQDSIDRAVERGITTDVTMLGDAPEEPEPKLPPPP